MKTVLKIERYAQRLTQGYMGDGRLRVMGSYPGMTRPSAKALGMFRAAVSAEIVISWVSNFRSDQK